MAGLGLGAALLACLVIHLVGRLAYVGLVFPAVLGLAVGVAVTAGVRIGKCRLPVAAGAIGLALGLGGYLLVHYLNYCSHVRASRKAVEAQLPAPVEKGAVAAKVDDVMRGRWGASGFSGYLTGWWRGVRRLLWVVEIAIVVGLAGWVPYSAAQGPFCEACDRWCDHGTALVAALDAREKVLDACDPETVGRLKQIEAVGGEGSRCVVALDFCPVCRRTGYLTVTAVEDTGSGGAAEKVLVSEADVSGDQLSQVIPDEETETAPAGPPKRIAEDEIPAPNDEAEGLCIEPPIAAPGGDDGDRDADDDSPGEKTSESCEKDGLEDGKV